MNRGVGVNDVARHCGVSASTVCRALNGREDINAETKIRIMAACEELGYTRNRFAGNLRLRRSDTVSCLLPAATNEMSVEKHYFLKQAVLKGGYRFSPAAYDDLEEAEELLGAAIGEQPAGIILGFVPSARRINALKKNNIPVVCYDCESEDFDSITLNRSVGVETAVAAMIEAGRRRILLLGAKADDVRGRGYCAALKKAGLDIDPELIIHEPFGRDLFEYGYTQGTRLTAELEFDAVQCVNDACAIGLMRALKEKDLDVPGTITVTGFDDIMVSRYQTPALSTIAQPKEQMAEKAVGYVFQRMQKPGAAQHTELDTAFIKRET